ncbi:uncharacterized protein MONBRDRAFT_24687 [Monosiga brevicollis MX1]|uniref:TLC domain-containing protein n=1 Tax=Monosiga brevicollis TaxID=81824 RepID=A9UX63_MONBE|nr:uncharacterized protein MONBRDRAFT_24687 [Monosiga brevicollis MX1]EDQ90335.1 predicted protein [Monosiga brevicollis MX1]|eukprot:XP_001745102.1 hypothetical protein [Monosiga brevicollis MX1]
MDRWALQTNPRALGWTLSTVTAIITAVAATGETINGLVQGYDSDEFFSSHRLSRFILTYVFVNFSLDLVLGSIDYPQFIDPLSGWTHHILFNTLILGLTYHDSHNTLFYAFIEEIPTLLLGLGNIHLPWRQDLLFGATFFLTRICYHAYHAYVILTHIHQPRPSVIYAALFTSLTFLLHVYWFSNWVRNLPKYLKAIARSANERPKAQ